MQHLEQKMPDITFIRVDADTVDNLVQKDDKPESVLSEDEQKTIKSIFEGVVGDQMASVQLEPMSPEAPPVQITKPEFMRRMKEMQSMQGMNLGEMPDTYNVVINTNNSFVTEKINGIKDEEKQKEVAHYLYDLALLNQNMLKGEALSDFVKKSMELVG
ncbi:MAG TPA: hypothetical protein ENK75_05070 [Saprospiraceae bacterium]|nr:hypothetical protein [Saprospiraceae bacterium]